MALNEWAASYELSPDGTIDTVSFLDNSLRDLKEQVRRRFHQGGHLMQVPSPDMARDGRHAVDAGGVGVSPDIYKSDGTTLLVTYTDTGVRVIAEPLTVDKLRVTDMDDLAYGHALDATTRAIPLYGASTVDEVVAITSGNTPKPVQLDVLLRVINATTANLVLEIDVDRDFDATYETSLLPASLLAIADVDTVPFLYHVTFFDELGTANDALTTINYRVRLSRRFAGGADLVWSKLTAREVLA